MIRYENSLGKTPKSPSVRFWDRFPITEQKAYELSSFRPRKPLRDLLIAADDDGTLLSLMRCHGRSLSRPALSKPSRTTEEAFDRAVEAVANASSRLLGELVTSAPPKDREVEAAKARARRAERQPVYT